MIDIVIVNYKSTDYLIQCLQSIRSDLGDLSARIHVQDNASGDGVAEKLAGVGGVILTCNRDNIGFGRAVNQALRASGGRYAVLLNPDTQVLPGFFQASIDFMEANPRVAIMGPRILEENGRLQNSARAFPTPLTALFGRSSLLSRWFPQNPVTTRNLLSLKSDGRSPMPVDWVSGACMVVRRSAIEDTGLFDERFFMYWEDADWCQRMWRNGWQVVYFPKPQVVHFVGVSSEKLMVRAAYEFHKSSYGLFKKYSKPTHRYTWPLVIAGLSVRFCIVLLSGGLIRWIDRHRRRPFPAGEAAFAARRRRVRVLRLIARLNIGGPAIHAHLLTNGLDRDRFESVLVTGRISPQEGDMSYLFSRGDIQPVTVPELQRDISFWMDFWSFLQIFRIVWQIRPDIVHTHTAKAGTSARFAVVIYELLAWRRVFKVHTFHGHAFKGYFPPFKTKLFIWIERLLAHVSDVIIAISESQKRELADIYRIAPRRKIRTIELGFDLEPFVSCSSLGGRLRRRLGVDPNTLLIGIVGRLVPIKNHEMFLVAARIFIQRHPETRVRFVIVGDGELRAALEERGRHLGLEQVLEFCGWVKEVPEVYADLDILSLTSLNEGTPVSIIEAMAAGVPVVATDAGGVRDLLGRAFASAPPGSATVCERGISCRINDPEGLADGWGHLREPMDPENPERIRRARDFVVRRYAKERLLDDVAKLYDELVSERRAAVRLQDPTTVGRQTRVAN